MHGVRTMNSKFPVLSAVSTLLRVLGWLASVGGIIVIYAAFSDGERSAALVGVGIVLSGLVVVAFGESIGVLFAIEKNTRLAGTQASGPVGSNPFRE